MGHPVLVADHEAGHAVAAAALGVPGRYAALTPATPNTLGSWPAGPPWTSFCS